MKLRTGRESRYRWSATPNADADGPAHRLHAVAVCESARCETEIGARVSIAGCEAKLGPRARGECVVTAT